MTDSSPTALPATFNAADVEAFLETRVTVHNRQRCMRVILNLITGKGETHKAKPGEAFLKGHVVTPSDDLDDLQRHVLDNAVALIARRFCSDATVQDAAAEASARLHNPRTKSGRTSAIGKRTRASYEEAF